MEATPVSQPRAARALFVLYLVTFAVCAISPYDRTVWFAENLPIVLLVGALVWVARHTRLSTTAWVFAAFLPVLHTIGGHYTFALVPFDLVTDTFGFERNHFDRICHFSVGLLAYPLAELLRRREAIRARWVLLVFPVTTILAVAALYEVFEWWFAVLGDPDAGHAVLGSQGDVWDAQRDMLADGLGALLAVAIFAWRGERDAAS